MPDKEEPLKIAVIGLGHLGTVAAGGLAAAGHDVTGLDIDDGKVQALQAGLVPIYEPGLQECVATAVDRGNLRFLHSDQSTECLNGVALITAGPERRRRYEPGACRPGVGQEPGTQGFGTVDEEYGPAGQRCGVYAKRPERVGR